MTTRVAFLRAVNVGKRTVAMARLASLVEGLGYDDVWTHINSGNVVFDAPAKPPVLYSLAPVAKARPAARDFAAYLQGKDAGAVFERAGFIVIHKE